MKKQDTYWKLFNILFGIFLLISISCKKDNISSEKLVTDIDGNSYHTVIIGTQEWFVENLKTTKYKDGTDIPNITGISDWASLTTPAYCNYNNTSNLDTINTYGRLYNWYTVNTGKLCPEGWHVPTIDELTILQTFLGGREIAGGKLKEKGTTHWLSPNDGATNESGFKALPSGLRFYNSSFALISYNGFFWTTSEYTEINNGMAWNGALFFNGTNFHLSYSDSKKNGLSIRCVKD